MPIPKPARARSPSASPGPGGRSKSPSLAQLKRTFSLYDVNGDGAISIDELMLAVCRLPGMLADESSVHAMLAAADIDCNGSLTEGEFIKIMRDVELGKRGLHPNWGAMSAASAKMTLLEVSPP